MNRDTLTDNAIVPDNPDRQLFLPREMIRSGLELATRIEQREGIRPLPGERADTEYTARCYLDVMAWVPRQDGSSELQIEQRSITGAAVYVVIRVQSEGIRFSCASSHLQFAGIPGNVDRFCLLNPLHKPDPFTIPLHFLHLFYTLRQREEALQHVSFENPAAGHYAHKGPATREANPIFDADRDCVETILTYVALREKVEPGQELFTDDPPLNITLVAIDSQGQVDPAASRELYQALLGVLEPGLTQRSYISLATLQQSMPSHAFQPDGGKAWELAYAGKYVYVEGRVEATSMHPGAGKLFLIVTPLGAETAHSSPSRKVALWVEDVQHVALGEKEGSFLLNDRRWIHLGKAYAFHGRVIQLSRFDPDLAGTDYNDLVILKAGLVDMREA